MRHFSSALGWMSTCDVYFLNFVWFSKLKKKKKEIQLGSLVKFLSRNESLQGLQEPSACSRQWTWVGGYRERRDSSWWDWRVKGWGGQWGCGELVKRGRKWGSVPTVLVILIMALVSTVPRSWHFLHPASHTSSSGRWLFTGWVNLRPTMLFKSYRKNTLSESDY